tara:strand:+ start:252 stop:893 length:642 start_codon:yes stop_codon:yes gene_type:complete
MNNTKEGKSSSEQLKRARDEHEQDDKEEKAKKTRRTEEEKKEIITYPHGEDMSGTLTAIDEEESELAETPTEEKKNKIPQLLGEKVHPRFKNRRCQCGSIPVKRTTMNGKYKNIGREFWLCTSCKEFQRWCRSRDQSVIRRREKSKHKCGTCEGPTMKRKSRTEKNFNRYYVGCATKPGGQPCDFNKTYFLFWLDKKRDVYDYDADRKIHFHQ